LIWRGVIFDFFPNAKILKMIGFAVTLQYAVR